MHPRIRFVFFVLAWFAVAAAVRPAAGQTVVRDGFEDTHVAFIAAPSALAVAPADRLLIASQYGRIYIYKNGALNSVPALDISDRVCAYRERGLLGRRQPSAR